MYMFVVLLLTLSIDFSTPGKDDSTSFNSPQAASPGSSSHNLKCCNTCHNCNLFTFTESSLPTVSYIHTISVFQRTKGVKNDHQLQTSCESWTHVVRSLDRSWGIIILLSRY